jgi:hypothetical protein
MKSVLVSLLVAGSVVLAVGCGGDNPGDNNNSVDAGTDAIVRPDSYIGDCQDDPVPVFEGSHQTLLNHLAIASPTAGIDLDFDGRKDNLLGSLGSIANGYIDDSMEVAEIIIPMEFFGLDSDTDDDCVNFTFLVGTFAPDQDDDGERTSGAVGLVDGDCNDWDAAITPANATDIPGDGVDNDCNGMADETFDGTDYIPSTDTADYDGDGWTLADGDCDDRVLADWPDAPAHWDPGLINPGQAEICGDGFDNNCDGVADEGCNPLTTDDGADETIPIDILALIEDQSEAMVVFRSGRVVAGVLYAGPSRFSFMVELEGRNLELNLAEPHQRHARRRRDHRCLRVTPDGRHAWRRALGAEPRPGAEHRRGLPGGRRELHHARHPRGLGGCDAVAVHRAGVRAPGGWRGHAAPADPLRRQRGLWRHGAVPVQVRRARAGHRRGR